MNTDGQSHDKVVACYIASWAAYRPMNGKIQSEKFLFNCHLTFKSFSSNIGSFTANDIDPQLCTHIIYTFAGLNNETFTIHSMVN